jgi:hypothetical protein
MPMLLDLRSFATWSTRGLEASMAAARALISEVISSCTAGLTRWLQKKLEKMTRNHIKYNHIA